MAANYLLMFRLTADTLYLCKYRSPFIHVPSGYLDSLSQASGRAGGLNL